MKATINGVAVEGTPQEIAEYQQFTAKVGYKLPESLTDRLKGISKSQINGSSTSIDKYGNVTEVRF